MKALTSFFDNFDLAKIVPATDVILEKVVIVMRWAVMVGPLILLVLGLVYLFLPPKEANHRFGFRTWFGMGSVEAWQFTQKAAGLAWGGLGLILTVVMAIISSGFKTKAPVEIVELAGKCMVWQIVLAAVSALVVSVLAAVLFDRHGNRRNKK